MKSTLVLVFALAVSFLPIAAQVATTDEGETDAAPVKQVEVVNFPDPQNVAGTVNVGNLPATQQVSGTVDVGNLPTSPDGSLLVSCPDTQQPYQFFGDIFGGPAVLSEAMPGLPIGDFDVDGATNSTVFWEVTAQVGSAQAYDAAVIIEGFFDGPPSIKVVESQLILFQSYPHYFCCNNSGACRGHPGIGPSSSSGTGSEVFPNGIGLPQLRLEVRVEHRTRNLCTDVSYPHYQGPLPTPIDVLIDGMSVFIR